MKNVDRSKLCPAVISDDHKGGSLDKNYVLVFSAMSYMGQIYDIQWTLYTSQSPE